MRNSTTISQSDGFMNAPRHQTLEGGEHKNIPQPMGLWWQRIDDRVFDQYIQQLLHQNLALEEAAARVVQARERVNIERGGFFPALTGNADASRSFSDVSGTRTYATTYGTDIGASWSIDLFGQIRRRVESAEALYQANVYEREALIHSLIADVLNQRVAIAVQAHLLTLARKNTQNRETVLGILMHRYNLGTSTVTARDLYLAEESYESARADIYRYQRSLNEALYRLDVLLGQKPGTTEFKTRSFPLLPAPMDVPVCLPIDLLDRRPDLKASELRVAAATADVGVAVADLYPDLTLGGSIGFSGDGLDNLFTADKLAGSILGSLTTRLFEGGSLRANIRLQEAEARELSASYAGDILEAMREVETALSHEQILEKELISMQRGLEALQNAERISYDRYNHGLSSLQGFLDAQQRRYVSEQNILIRQQDKWKTRINLYLALGGDWLNQGNGLNVCRQRKARDG